MTYSGNTKVVIVFLLVACAIPQIFGLQCHSCLYMAGVMGDETCQSIVSDGFLKSCSMENAINSKQTRAIQAFSPEVKFNLVCLKAVVKAGDVDLLIRGCYAQEEKKMTTWTGESECQNANQNFWSELGGKLTKASQDAIKKDAKMSVCACFNRDGCNSATSLQLNYPFTIIILITVFKYIFKS